MHSHLVLVDFGIALRGTPMSFSLCCLIHYLESTVIIVFTIPMKTHTWYHVPGTYSILFLSTTVCNIYYNIYTGLNGDKHFAVEDFVTLPMGKKIYRWGNVMFGHGFDKRF